MDHLKYMVAYAEPLMKKGVLDVGSGEGDFVIAAAAAGFNAAGIELNPDKVAITRAILAQKRLKAEIREGVGEKMPFPDEMFGFVNCSEVTEHVENAEEVLKEIFRVLIPGGVAYLSFHNRYGYFDQHFKMFGINWMPRAWADVICRRQEKIRKYNGKSGRQLLGEMHYFRYSQIVKMLNSLGFRVQDTRELRIEKRFKNLLVKSLVLAIYRVFRCTFINTFHVLATKA
jgi:2-polyprenyl-3-methyl-5-hydroxy-6-metoxy-1,4-benzoquinol methylase